MNCWKEYIDYIKDNPEGYWFKRKLYGFGWTPAKPAGWITLGIYLLFLLGVMLYAEVFAVDSERSTRVIVIVTAATFLLFAILWSKGESLKWQWGKAKSER